MILFRMRERERIIFRMSYHLYEFSSIRFYAPVVQGSVFRSNQVGFYWFWCHSTQLDGFYNCYSDWPFLHIFQKNWLGGELNKYPFCLVFCGIFLLTFLWTFSWRLFCWIFMADFLRSKLKSVKLYSFRYFSILSLPYLSQKWNYSPLWFFNFQGHICRSTDISSKKHWYWSIQHLLLPYGILSIHLGEVAEWKSTPPPPPFLC